MKSVRLVLQKIESECRKKAEDECTKNTVFAEDLRRVSGLVPFSYSYARELRRFPDVCALTVTRTTESVCGWLRLFGTLEHDQCLSMLIDH